MKIVDNVAYLIRRIGAITGRAPGKTALQKWAYLAQADGVDLGFPYGAHCYGVYSEALAASVALLAEANIVRAERKGNSVLMEVDDSYAIESDLGKEAEEKLARVIERYRDKSPAELGLLASTHYVMQKTPGLDLPGVVRGVQKIEGKDCGEESITTAIKEMGQPVV